MKQSRDKTAAFYDAHVHEYAASTLGVDMEDVYARFLQNLPAKAHILDAGCGAGRDGKAFAERGFIVTLVDASPGMAEYASAFTGLPSHVLRFQDMEYDATFDGIWACASLLHIPKSEMHDVPCRLSRALKFNGIFYISLIEGDGERSATDGRLFNYYTSTSFRAELATVPVLRELAFWKTANRRGQQDSATWLNFLIEKRTPADTTIGPAGGS